MFGTSAKWLSVIEENGAVPKNTNKLDSLKVIFSTGSPLKPTSFDYVYAKIKSDLVLGSITGLHLEDNFPNFSIFASLIYSISLFCLFVCRWVRYNFAFLRPQREPASIPGRDTVSTTRDGRRVLERARRACVRRVWRTCMHQTVSLHARLLLQRSGLCKIQELLFQQISW